MSARDVSENHKQQSSSERAWCAHDSNCLPRETLHNLARTLRIALAIPALPAIPSLYLSVLVKLDGMLFGLWVGGVPHQGHALVDLEDSRIEWGCATDVEVEDFGARLVSNEEQVLEASRDQESMLLALALKQRVCRDGRR